MCAADFGGPGHVSVVLKFSMQSIFVWFLRAIIYARAHSIVSMQCVLNWPCVLELPFEFVHVSSVSDDDRARTGPEQRTKHKIIEIESQNSPMNVRTAEFSLFLVYSRMCQSCENVHSTCRRSPPILARLIGRSQHTMNNNDNCAQSTVSRWTSKRKFIPHFVRVPASHQSGYSNIRDARVCSGSSHSLTRDIHRMWHD